MDIFPRKSSAQFDWDWRDPDQEPMAFGADAHSITNWLLNQQHPSDPKSGVVALTAPELRRLKGRSADRYQVVKPAYQVPPPSVASSVDGDEDEYENEDERTQEVGDKIEDLDGIQDEAGSVQDGIPYGTGLVQDEIPDETQSVGDEVQDQVQEDAPEPDQEGAIDEPLTEEEDNFIALREVLLATHDPADPFESGRFLSHNLHFHRTREAVAERKKAANAAAKARAEPNQPAQATEDVTARNEAPALEHDHEEGAQEQVEQDVTARTDLSALERGNEEAHRKQAEHDATAALERADEEASRMQAEHDAIAALKKGDAECARKHEVKDLRHVQERYSGFYIAAPTMAESMLEVHQNYSDYYELPLVDPSGGSKIILGRGLEHQRRDTLFSEEYNPSDYTPFDEIPDDDKPRLIHPPRSQAPAQAIILHLLFKGNTVDDVATELSLLDNDFLFKSESRWWKRTRVPELWQLNEPSVEEVLVVARGYKKQWWEADVDANGQPMPNAMRMLQSRLHVKNIKRLARQAVENYLWWRFMGQRIHCDIPSGHVIREYDG